MAVELSPRAAAGRGGSAAAGFSLIEVTIAAALMLLIALSILPLFSQAAVSNRSGADSTSVSNFARERIEEMFQLPFNSPEMTIDAGSSKVFDEYYSLNDRVWKDGAAPTADPALWTRTTTVRQYNATALDDGVVDPAEALPSGTLPISVHFKEITVAVRSTRAGGPFGPAKQITLRMLKSQ